ncbi:Aste57867_2839 [Aphanomyces stellatus]|uniref:Aste57867_2839 protein n=1 Tax=Aphanomyces stellatus TaxID=120398 RepID=A0A485KCP8_9STRA|nr:hypothetical protein As57867_002831 [Aphanomyces stellatus]VFT80026.1 Aste57867_2839 [Aphanomyces stellatus]
MQASREEGSIDLLSKALQTIFMSTPIVRSLAKEADVDAVNQNHIANFCQFGAPSPDLLLSKLLDLCVTNDLERLLLGTASLAIAWFVEPALDI